MSKEQNEHIRTILEVKCDFDSGAYIFKAVEGVSVEELAFITNALIKCLIRDGVLKTKDEYIDLVNKYFNDPQYEEVKKEDN